jgi:Fic family protein
MIESPQRIEPARLEDVPQALSDLVAEISGASAKLESALNPKTASSLADMIRIMNSYYSNLIEGHVTRPRDIEAAIEARRNVTPNAPSTAQIVGAFDGEGGGNPSQRNLLDEAVAHVRVQKLVDEKFAAGQISEPASLDTIQWLHTEFYRDAPPELLRIRGRSREFMMVPGAWRSNPEHDVTVGRHQPPSSARVDDFMSYFEKRYRFAQMGKSAKILAIPAAHHRLNYIHPFPDGNGRVSRLMSHAMAQAAGIGAHGLWSISRGLARGLESRSDYMLKMNHADMPRQGDLDGRGNLSQRAFETFIGWFLKVCLDQITFMANLFEIEKLGGRMRNYVEKSETLKPEALRLLQEALIRGDFERSDASRITSLPERTARRILADVVREGLLASDTPKGRLSLRFPIASQDILFPRLFAES